MSASRLTMVILCMTMSMTLLSRDCHLSRAALLKLWLAPFFWNFFLKTEAKEVGLVHGAPPQLTAAGPRWPLPGRAPDLQARVLPSASPGRAQAVGSGRGVVPQEVVGFAIPLVHDAGDGAGPRLCL